MTWDLNDKEFAAVSVLPDRERYLHFVKRVADWGEIWSLCNDGGWVLLGDDSGHEVIPVWPHQLYAHACANGDWAGTQPHPVPLSDWLEKWTPGLIRDNRLVAVFPTPGNSATVVAPQRLFDDLKDESSQMFDEDEESPLAGGRSENIEEAQ